jgi:hypothetical protein
LLPFLFLFQVFEKFQVSGFFSFRFQTLRALPSFVVKLCVKLSALCG